MKMARLFSVLWVVILLLSAGKVADSDGEDCTQTIIPNGCGKRNCNQQCQKLFGGVGICVPRRPSSSNCVCSYDCH
ncbi:hypothetical protein ABFS82_10G173900 [Erythranthe guttata]